MTRGTLLSLVFLTGSSFDVNNQVGKVLLRQAIIIDMLNCGIPDFVDFFRIAITGIPERFTVADVSDKIFFGRCRQAIKECQRQV